MGHVFFTTGVVWLGGFGAGSLYGGFEGHLFLPYLNLFFFLHKLFPSSPSGWKGATGPSARIRFNSVMNGISKHGSKLGNAVGSIGYLF